MTGLEVTCPACGAAIEAPSTDELVIRSREHTLDAHDYDILAEHVLSAAVPAGGDGGPVAVCETGGNTDLRGRRTASQVDRVLPT